MPVADKKKRTKMGVERARYARADEESEGRWFRRKIGTTDNSCPYTVDSLLKPWRLARGINPIGEEGRSTTRGKEK